MLNPLISLIVIYIAMAIRLLVSLELLLLFIHFHTLLTLIWGIYAVEMLNIKCLRMAGSLVATLRFQNRKSLGIALIKHVTSLHNFTKIHALP